MTRSLGSHQRPVHGATSEWLTPPGIIAALGPFDCDPCAAVDQPWETAAMHLTIKDDGLTRNWYGLVWLNPPFGAEAAAWFSKLADHGRGVGLCPARTETAWFCKQVWGRADAVLFLAGRPHFHHPDGTRAALNSGAPICLAGYGPVAVDRLRASGLPGTLVEGWRR